MNTLQTMGAELLGNMETVRTYNWRRLLLAILLRRWSRNRDILLYRCSRREDKRGKRMDRGGRFIREEMGKREENRGKKDGLTYIEEECHL
jgi:hypothetical protein